MVFKSSLDKTSKAITIGVILLLIVVSLFISYPFSDIENLTTSLFSGLLFMVITIVAYAFSTKSIELNQNDLYVKRPFDKVVILLSDIIKIEKIDYKDLSFAMRKFGSGGLFGYFGKFWNKQQGSMTWYVTNMKNPVMIETKNGKKIVLTPDDREQFLEQFTILEKTI